MIRQAEGLNHNPRLMLIDDADRPAKWYFALKANLIESAYGRADGAPDGWAGNVEVALLKASRQLKIECSLEGSVLKSRVRAQLPAYSKSSQPPPPPIRMNIKRKDLQKLQFVSV